MHRNRFRALLALLAALALGGAACSAPAEEVPDAWITLRVKTALLLEPFVVGPRLHVDTLDGTVVLYGEQPTDRSVQAAVRAARGIEGVREVVPRVDVASAEEAPRAPERSDEAIRAAVEERLAGEPSLGASAIEVVSVADGVVTLAGRAESRADLHRALELTHAVTGVRAVDSEVAAPLRYSEDPFAVELEEARRALGGAGSEGPAAAGAPEARPAARDAALTAAVKLRLGARGDLPDEEVHVDTRRGEVVLFGTVPSESARERAGALARELELVDSVANELRVAGASE